ncbi:MAG: bifunctional (p)ppGpp synthetase/guanosine-3',5'-bis(diphosphate) 3'-pyrophosphohydrolase [Acidobacteria bacterium]|nr:bifunctional (p)ppGpp synthetase/guanosine-3',5'-bis(diphosphate) 3'-pyrophosphohydrolase [Acidobacteriota bacterium]
MVIKKAVSSMANFMGIGATRFDDVATEVRTHHPDADIDFLDRAFRLGAQAHEGQTRMSGEPYFNHPIEVAMILAKSKLDLETVASGFLHDVLEDCDITVEDLDAQFGTALALIVDGVSKIGKVKFRDKHQAQAENYRKMIMAMAIDLRVLIVKLADRLHNMRTLSHLPDEKRRRISQETLDIYAPLSHRIGMAHFKTELEELAFQNLKPQAYRDLDRQLASRDKKNREMIDQTTKSIQQLLAENNIHGEVTSRIKSHYSIYNKLVNKNTTIEGIYDYYAFRIFVDSVRDCYAMLGILHERWRPIPGRFKDFIATPKPNLYQSLHTTLINASGSPFEVQIRTQMMHRIAEEGVAAHWTYKNGRLMSIGKADYTRWLKKLADEQTQVKDAHEFLETIKGELKSDDILVFTPAGEIKTLPRGATPLDFAYMIHTELGHRATGAKVDGKMIGLRAQLHSGNIVEITTSPTQTPSQEWLKIVQTPSARNKIRQWLRAEEKTKSIDIGKKIFEKELRRKKVPLKAITKDVIAKQLDKFQAKKIEDFYSSIGFGRISPVKAVEPFLPDEAKDKKTALEVKESRIKSAINRITNRSKQQVTVRGQSDVLVYLAKCCRPIIGDPIVGYITRGRGVAVHKSDCKTLNQMGVSPERQIDVEWERHSEKQIFGVRVRVYTEDRPGMIADISQRIAATDTNVKQFKASVDTQRSMGIFDFVVEIHSLDHLEKVFGSLRRIKGLLSYERLS